jgi:hypothetical protein
MKREQAGQPVFIGFVRHYEARRAKYDLIRTQNRYPKANPWTTGST